MRRGLAVAAALLMLVALAPAARACSCGGGDARAQLSRSAAAFVGTLVDGPDGREGDDLADVPWEFTVERSVKGDLGERVTVWSAPNGAMCGLEVREGQRIGLFLAREGDRWTSGLCSQIDPDRLIAAAQPLPAPDGSGPAAFVVNGQIGDNGILALDAKGRTLAYGKAPGPRGSWDLAVCPGGTRVATLNLLEGKVAATLYELPSLRVLRTREVAQESSWPMALGCGDAAGDDLFVFYEKAAHPQSQLTLYRLRGDEPPQSIWSGPGSVPVFDPAGRFAIVPVRNPMSLTRVELPSGAARQLAALPEPPTKLALHPAGRSVLVLTGDPESSRATRLLVVGADGRTTAQREMNGAHVQVMLWSGDDQVTLATADDVVQTFDGLLRLVAEWRGRLGFSTTRGGRIYTLTRAGDVETADPRSGGLTAFRDLPEGHYIDIQALPERRQSGGSPTTAPTTTAPPVTAPSTPETAPPPTTARSGTELASEPARSTGDPGVPGPLAALAVLALAGAAFATQLVARRALPLR